MRFLQRLKVITETNSFSIIKRLFKVIIRLSDRKRLSSIYELQSQGISSSQTFRSLRLFQKIY